ncbi:bile acid:sodium symporter family protein [Alteribacillus bidgolensis]|uniref:Bile acid:Na+ symporter, BASS family n=1 Tax=Alteribacillus bidgolensis TaxID=930129 RepID=A0A1G8MZ73_9BACI|nr:bile acid:sodium symporter family protein [Alteribacillus bidgolensis]SDI73291.1 bile acid:Na+ symporter, BASS family [Alteribacillus bidgolensis]
MDKMQLFVNKFFALFVIIVSFIAFYFPDYFIWITEYIAVLLGIVMFGMGLTMKVSDFVIVVKKPLSVCLGVLAQFIIMPIAAFSLAVILQLPPELAAGLVLVGACPGGTASNVMVYLAKGDIAVSVAMTSVSTMLAPILTPFILMLLANEWLPVEAGSMFISIIQVIIIPISLGLLVNSFFPRAVTRSVRFLPVISVAAIIAIVGAVIAANKENILSTGVLVMIAVILHNSFGLLLGYAAAKISGLDETKRRAVALEVGMQNSALGTQLATAHFTPLAALPSAVFSVWHNISGPILVGWWNKKDQS